MSLMTHVVAGYPSKQECIELMRGMEAVGVSMLEVQIPFSDPIADGETIMRANDVALARGMSIESSFELIRDAGLKIDVFVMSYYQKVIHYGVNKFCEQAKRSGVKGFIIPDLPYDAPDFEEFLSSVRRYHLTYVPVVSPDMNPARLKQVVKNADELIYLTSIKGITGKSLSLNDELIKTAREIKRLKPNAQLAIGFGIKSKKEVSQILKFSDIAVIGSAVIREIDSSGTGQAIEFVRRMID